MGGQQPVMIFDQQGGIKSNVEVGLDDLKEDIENLRVVLNMVLDGQKTIFEKLNRIEEVLLIKDNVVKEEPQVTEKIKGYLIRDFVDKFPEDKDDKFNSAKFGKMLIKYGYVTKFSSTKYKLTDKGKKCGWLGFDDHSNLMILDCEKAIKFVRNVKKAEAEAIAKVAGLEDESD